MSLFPPLTEIVVGPGFKAAPQLLPGFPKKLDSPVLVSDFAGRQLREIDFEVSGLEIGGYRAFDFFGDGSFYLLGRPSTITNLLFSYLVMPQIHRAIV
jgi:hypothetical protein